MCFHSQLPSYLRPPSRPQASAFPLMRSQGDGCPGRTSSSLPLGGFAVLNDTPVACQIRGPTDPQGDRWHGEAVADEVSPRSGVSVVFVSDGDSFAPRRERFFCLRRPHFFQQRKKWGKERRQKLRFCTSSARYTRQRFAAYSRGHSLSSPLSDKRTVPAFTGAEASAAACFSHGRCFSLLPPHLPSLPLEGFAPLNAAPLKLSP